MQVNGLLRKVTDVLLFDAPLDAQLIITRRCNLSCGYCSEYDSTSEPVPTDELLRRIDVLHKLRSANITLLGGEPLLHPDVGEIVAWAGRRSNTSLVTNGFLLRPAIIQTLNQAGLNNLTISVDTLQADPNRYIQKSLRSLRTKLERLKATAKFDVHVTTVLCENSSDEFRELVDQVTGMGFRMSLNLIHNDKGYVTINGPRYLELYDYFYSKGKPFTFIDYAYNKKLLEGEEPSWKCRAGARYLYVDEFGNVELCASQRGRLGKPLADYTRDDLRAQSKTYKGCEEGCSVGCAFRCSAVDNSRLQFAASVVRGYFRGTMSDNSAKSPARGLAPQADTAIADD